jgi:two-component system NtrC family sensor kinase
LSQATEVIGRGEFDVKMDVRSRDEIGDLARGFERMATELKETQTQLIRSEKLAAVGQLGAGITHEVKNPITGLVGFAQLIKENSSNQAKVEEFAKLIEDSARRCTEILVNFLKFTRKEPRKFERLDVNQVVEDVAKIINHHMMIHGVQLKVETGQGVPIVWGRASEIHQAILNLAINAQQAMPGEGMVRMTTRRDDGTATIEVSDNGPGIPKENLDRIFEPFFTTKPAGEGTGLGLSIVYRIVRDHKGTILVDSQAGKGTTFTIRLPEHMPGHADQA